MLECQVTNNRGDSPFYLGINPMNKQSQLPSTLRPEVERASLAMKSSGSIGFWIQLVLGVISTVTVLFASPGLLGEEKSTPGAEFGIFCAICGLVALGGGIYYSIRYRTIAKLLRSPDASQRPKKADTIRVIRMGLMVNLIGMVVTIIGAEAIVGIVLAKTLNIAQGTLATPNTTQFIKPIDLFIIQANTNTITAHFSGVLSSLWLLNRITR